MNAELQRLREALDGLRAGVLKKLTGVSDQDARRTTVDSGTNLAGLLPAMADIIREQIDGQTGR